jgi:hypothetical protein
VLQQALGTVHLHPSRPAAEDSELRMIQEYIDFETTIGKKAEAFTEPSCRQGGERMLG